VYEQENRRSVINFDIMFFIRGARGCRCKLHGPLCFFYLSMPSKRIGNSPFQLQYSAAGKLTYSVVSHDRPFKEYDWWTTGKNIITSVRSIEKDSPRTSRIYHTNEGESSFGHRNWPTIRPVGEFVEDAESIEVRTKAA